ncbi:GMC family oxidoreductase [soil metagenome]
MFIDIKELAHDTTVQSDICVIGAGPAGVALATELLQTGLKVSIIESGTLDQDASDLGQPAKSSVFPDHRGIWTTRRFGGNGNLWHVNAGTGPNHLRLLPMTDADFDKREWMPDSGWPISMADLAPYYDRAQSWFGLEQRSYGPEDWEGGNAPRLPLEGTGLRTGMFHFAYRNVMLEDYRGAIAASPDITVYCNATAVRLDTDDTGERITGVRTTNAAGHKMMFAADVFVMAQGGLATPQLLLASNDRHANGIGNAHDLVGRYFMDHPLLFGGIFIPSSRDLIDRMTIFDLRRIDGMSAMGHIQLTDKTLREEACANISSILFPRRSMGKRREAGFQASQRLRLAAQGRAAWSVKDAFSALYGIDGVGQQFYDRLVSPISHLGIGGWSKKDKPGERFDHFEVLHQAEQPPRHDNRIVLGEERDALGNRRIEMHWKWHDEDVALVHKTQDIIARELRKSGLGEFRIQRPFEVKTSSTTHYMGTARMNDDPSKGVVDSECRVHGISNLFIAGSSVFPTGGYANPTLSIVAMSIRIADRVKRDFQSAATSSSVRTFAPLINA